MNSAEKTMKDKIKREFKPNVFLMIFMLLISVAVYGGGFWLALYEKNYEMIGVFSIASVIATFGLGITVSNYFHKWIDYKTQLKLYEQDSENYKI